MVPERARDLILGGAIVSIILNPFIFKMVARIIREPATAAAA
jgi:predicted Kef-type K+ transport protein